MATITVVAASRGGQQQPLPHPDTLSPQQLPAAVLSHETLSPQQLCEWVIQRGRPGGGGYVLGGTRQQRQQSQPETPSPQQPREWFSQRRVSSCVGVAALGASESASTLGASESASALGASASNATGASESAASADALHTFTLDSGASRCFFRDCTTVTPLATHVPVSLADPS
ncbi:unnamed protein product [Closterium sp. NIES-54]